ncbi:MAG: hypothetical protein MI824_02875 [Hyphomicrobiales bacterium]|nr:hypothetical protein [Hyphomicrobiales bacterium]
MRMARLPWVLLAGAVLSLTGCKDTDRPTSYEKGVYGGPADEKLTPAQVEALRHRGALQNQ